MITIPSWYKILMFWANSLFTYSISFVLIHYQSFAAWQNPHRKTTVKVQQAFASQRDFCLQLSYQWLAILHLLTETQRCVDYLKQLELPENPPTTTTLFKTLYLSVSKPFSINSSTFGLCRCWILKFTFTQSLHLQESHSPTLIQGRCSKPSYATCNVSICSKKFTQLYKPLAFASCLTHSIIITIKLKE